MAKSPAEWILQADYDMESAEWMNGRRLGYAIFACHLSIEKALKGIYHKQKNEIPPYTNNLIYLLKQIGIRPSEDKYRVFLMLNEAQIMSRYPEDIATFSAAYNFEKCGRTHRREQGYIAMDKAAVLETIELFRQALERNGILVDRIVLYGSFSRGNAHDGSDIDLVVVSPSFEGKTLWERIAMLTDALCELFEPIEAVAKTPQEWDNSDSLIVDFAKQGEIVYAA